MGGLRGLSRSVSTVLTKGTIFFVSKCSGTVGVSDGNCPSANIVRTRSRGILQNSERKFSSDIGDGDTLMEGELHSAELGIRRCGVNIHSRALARILCVSSLMRRKLLRRIGRQLRRFRVSKVLSDNVLRRLARSI